ncbi:MAG: glycoside hydrolase family 2 [Candidatus Aminicenantes bacterium]|nr:glycoside hydrolase family 2 [Candidatus Aminicenantes bacterium]
MTRKRSFFALVIFGAVLLLTALEWSKSELSAQYWPGMETQNRLSLRVLPETTTNLTDWFIQSSKKIQEDGPTLSRPGIMIDRWYPARVPSTVLGTLVDNNVYDNVFFGKNLDLINPEEFQVSWWYRTEFLLPAYPGKSTALLELDGVNYRANIWLNGQKVADASEIFGAFRRFRLDISKNVKIGEKNVLAIEVIPPVKGEPSIGFVDWNPAPPDRSMGLWRPVRVRLLGEVAINEPFVQTSLDTKSLKEARLTFSADLQNYSEKPVTGTVKLEVENIRLSQEVKLEPKETKRVIFSPERYQELVIKNPRVWWTHDLGKPELYLAAISFSKKMEAGEKKLEQKTEPKTDKEKGREEKLSETEKKWGKEKESTRTLPQFKALEAVSDFKIFRFGIREVKDYLTPEGYRGYLLNGRKILIRGGGWTDDLFLNNRPRKLRAELLYARHLNLNALRLEGFWGTSEDMYNLCDELGLLLMVGWSCQWEWENHLGKPTDPKFGGIVSPEDMELIAKSFRDQVRWLRNHPSIFVWALASDLVPKPELEKEYHRLLAEEDPTRPFLNSTGTRVSPVSGPSGVKMNGPYDWVPPNYWYEDKKNGGAFGFNTETGPGPQVPVLESLRKMIPEESLWPPDENWNYHCSRGMFKSLDRYHEAMRERLGWPQNIEEYVRKAQFLNYEGTRAMFEAFVVRRYKATGVIQWMYNSAWPKLWWQLYDYFLMPTGAFYGVKKACQPLHLIYDYESREVIASNLSLRKAEKLKALVRLFDSRLEEKYRQEFPLSLEPDSKVSLTRIDLPEASEPLYFLDLRIIGEKNTLVDQNFYCLPPLPDLLDFEKTTWFVTPVKKYADLQMLNNLPQAKVNYRWKVESEYPVRRLTLELENVSPALAFNLEIKVFKRLRQNSVVPIFLDDNYLTLLPGEKRTVRGFFFEDDLEGDEVEIRLNGWNVKSEEKKKLK